MKNNSNPLTIFIMAAYIITAFSKGALSDTIFGIIFTIYFICLVIYYIISTIKAKNIPIKRIAVIENGYVRDAQIFSADPAVIETEPDWENNYRDMKNPCQYVGIFEGLDENEIIQKAAEHEGVHPDIISLIELYTGAGDIL